MGEGKFSDQHGNGPSLRPSPLSSRTVTSLDTARTIGFLRTR